MAPRKKAPPYYTEDELKAIKAQWLEDKKKIDLEMQGIYHRKIDVAYIKYLANKNLQVLFKHAVHLHWGGLVEGEFYLHEEEKGIIEEVYEGVKKNGYYDRSKEKEKRTRARLGKAVSRQTHRKYFKK